MRFSRSILIRWAASVALALALVIGASACSNDPEDNVDQNEQQIEDGVDEKEKRSGKTLPDPNATSAASVLHPSGFSRRLALQRTRSIRIWGGTGRFANPNGGLGLTAVSTLPATPPGENGRVRYPFTCLVL